MSAEKIVQEYERLKRLVDAVGDDVLKAVGGNQTAGTRVRKAMQDIKNAAQGLRVGVLDLRKTEAGPPPT